MREVGASLGVPIHVFGPETHMTAIVSMAFGKIISNIIYLFRFFTFIYSGKSPIVPPEQAELTTANFLLPTSVNVNIKIKKILLNNYFI
jgi:ATP citrate (pro-S)-lyase